MITPVNLQDGPLDSLQPTMPVNSFLGKINAVVDWRPVEQALHKISPAKRGHSQHPPLVLFKMFFLQHCYHLSAAQCAEQVRDRLSWRAFVGLGWQDPGPDAPALVRFRQRLRDCGLQEELLRLINQQLEAQGLMIKSGTLANARLVQMEPTLPPSTPSS